jgi:hypothetical protein
VNANERIDDGCLLPREFAAIRARRQRFDRLL